MFKYSDSKFQFCCSTTLIKSNGFGLSHSDLNKQLISPSLCLARQFVKPFSSWRQNFSETFGQQSKENHVIEQLFACLTENKSEKLFFVFKALSCTILHVSKLRKLQILLFLTTYLKEAYNVLSFQTYYVGFSQFSLNAISLLAFALLHLN